MQRKKEIEMLIARYMTDIAALEGREEDFMRQSDILENLIPNVLVSYMGNVIQTSQDKSIPEDDIDTEVRNKLEHLKGVLNELQQVVGLVKEEKSKIRKRIEELNLLLTDQSEKIKETDTPVQVLARVPEITKTCTVNENKTNHPKTEVFDIQQMEYKELLPSETIDWKKRYEDLQKQVINSTEKLNSSSQKLKESEGDIKNLGEGYSKLKKELKLSMLTLEKKTDLLISTLFNNEEQDKNARRNLQADLVGKGSVSEKLDTLSKYKNINGCNSNIPSDSEMIGKSGKKSHAPHQFSYAKEFRVEGCTII